MNQRLRIKGLRCSIIFWLNKPCSFKKKKGHNTTLGILWFIFGCRESRSALRGNLWKYFICRKTWMIKWSKASSRRATEFTTQRKICKRNNRKGSQDMTYWDIILSSVNSGSASAWINFFIVLLSLRLGNMSIYGFFLFMKDIFWEYWDY